MGAGLRAGRYLRNGLALLLNEVHAFGRFSAWGGHLISVLRVRAGVPKVAVRS